MFWRTWTILLCAAVVVAAPVSLTAKTIFVDANAAGVNDGSSWPNAYRYLQDALADARTANEPVEIRVAQGVYRPDQGSDIVLGDRDATFRLARGVTLEGGYAGLGADDPDVRDAAKYLSVLSGDLYGNDVLVQTADQLLGEPTRADNCRHVVTANLQDLILTDQSDDSPLATGATIDGFVIIGGQDDVDAYSAPAQGGAGVLLLAGALTVANCTIQSCATCNVGGGMYNMAESLPALSNCAFKCNYAEYGGGIADGRLYAMSDGCRMTMSGCTFTGNCAFQGGALFAYGGRTESTGCTFQDNSATGSDTASFGGALYLLSGEVVLTDCSFSSNTAVRGAAISEAGTKAEMNRCTFDRNTANAGAGIDLSDGNSVLNQCSFTANAASTGGAVYSLMGTIAFSHCLFAGNGDSSEWRHGPPAHQEGGAIYLSGTATLANCTFHGNRAQKGRSLWMSRSDVTITNSILWDDAGPIYTDSGDGPAVTYSDVLGAWPGQGNIAADPCFAQPGYWSTNDTPDSSRDDFWVDGDYHLKSQAGRWDPQSGAWILDAATSPCIDAGDPNTPICDEPQPNGGRIDMGVYGSTAEAGKSCTQVLSSCILPYFP